MSRSELSEALKNELSGLVTNNFDNYRKALVQEAQETSGTLKEYLEGLVEDFESWVKEGENFESFEILEHEIILEILSKES
jgi:secreted Zn-dependent insulinase-like peptidase